MNWRLKSTNNSDSNSQQRQQQHLIIIDLRYVTTANNQQAEATQILNYYLIFYRIQVGTQTHLNTHISYNKEPRRTTVTRRLHWNIRSFDEETTVPVSASHILDRSIVMSRIFRLIENKLPRDGYGRRVSMNRWANDRADTKRTNKRHTQTSTTTTKNKNENRLNTLCARNIARAPRKVADYY